jgi:hypothetical protein
MSGAVLRAQCLFESPQQFDRFSALQKALERFSQLTKRMPAEDSPGKRKKIQNRRNADSAALSYPFRH